MIIVRKSYKIILSNIRTVNDLTESYENTKKINIYLGRETNDDLNQNTKFKMNIFN